MGAADGRTYTARPVLERRAKLIRGTAWALVAAGVAAPIVRRRVKLPPAAVLGAAAGAPVALCVARPRRRSRDAAVCALNMWAYLAAYELPHDNPDRLERRGHLPYPIIADRVVGLRLAPPPPLRP